MPRVRKPAPRRKPLARRRRARAQLTTVNRSLQPVANRYICRQKYAATLVTNGVGQYILNMNSLFDPDRTGIGHQPYGFDVLSTLYNRYRVTGCKWRIQNPTGAVGSAIILATVPNNDASLAFADTGVMLENPRCKYVIQNPGAPVTSLRGSLSMPTLTGRTKAQYMADDRYQSDVTTSPAELALLYVQTFNSLTGVALGGIGFTITLEFSAEWFDLKHIVQS